MAFRPTVAFVVALTAGGCGPKNFNSLCSEFPPPEACNQACDPSPTAANSCPAGYFCATDGECDIQCTTGGSECGSGYACTDEGRCVDDSEPGTSGPDANCPAVNFTPMPVTPSIGLVLDQSGSMYQPYSNRYAEMREALVGTGGVVGDLETKAYFGASLYTCGGANGNGPLVLNETPRALNNVGGIRALVDSKLGDDKAGGGTPTHAGINAMVAAFAANPAPAGSPPVIVLATDGEPNTCSNTGNGGRGASVDAARAAFNAGIPLYVLAINITGSHFTDLANAGRGHQAGQPDYPYYQAANAAELKAAFDTIIRGVISCDLSLTASIDETQAMNGVVSVNGTDLTYGTDWTLVNGNVIRLMGAACDTLKSTTNPAVNAQFPCGAVIY